MNITGRCAERSHYTQRDTGGAVRLRYGSIHICFFPDFGVHGGTLFGPHTTAKYHRAPSFQRQSCLIVQNPVRYPVCLLVNFMCVLHMDTPFGPRASIKYSTAVPFLSYSFFVSMNPIQFFAICLYCLGPYMVLTCHSPCLNSLLFRQWLGLSLSGHNYIAACNTWTAQIWSSHGCIRS